MPSTVKESRIVEMKFRNKDFEKNAKQSIKTLDELEEKLQCIKSDRFRQT